MVTVEVMVMAVTRALAKKRTSVLKKGQTPVCILKILTIFIIEL